MLKILFICHGNICRSPMAEFLFRELVRNAGLSERFEVSSAATSTEEIGNDIHPGTKEVLRRNGIPFSPRRARQLTRADYGRYDLIVGMDEANMRNLQRMTDGDPEKKCTLLLSLTGESRSVADPWYTGDFEATYRDVLRGCEALLDSLAQA